MIRRLSLCAWDVKDTKLVAWGKLFLLKRACALDIINLVAVADELRRLRWHESETSELVDGVERVRWLSLCDKLDDVSLRACNILICQVILWLIECNMEHAWT